MPNDPIRFPAGSEWVHRGALPPLTIGQARLALELCLLVTPECVFISTDNGHLAGLVLSSGRSALLRLEIVRGSNGVDLRIIVEEVHEDDVPEVTRIHEGFVRRYPEIARSLRAVAVRKATESCGRGD